MVILDTDHVSLLRFESSAVSARLKSRLAQLSAEGVFLSIISFEEEIRGWMAFMGQAKTVKEQLLGYQRMTTMLYIDPFESLDLVSLKPSNFND